MSTKRRWLLLLSPFPVAGAAHVLAEGSCSCFSVTAHNFLASSASCACTDGVAILQSARYAPDLPFSSGAVAAYTEVAAPYIARKLVKKDRHSISADFQCCQWTNHDQSKGWSFWHDQWGNSKCTLFLWNCATQWRQWWISRRHIVCHLKSVHKHCTCLVIHVWRNYYTLSHTQARQSNRSAHTTVPKLVKPGIQC